MCETETKPGEEEEPKPIELDPTKTYYRLTDITEFNTEEKCWLAVQNKVR